MEDFVPWVQAVPVLRVLGGQVGGGAQHCRGGGGEGGRGDGGEGRVNAEDANCFSHVDYWVVERHCEHAGTVCIFISNTGFGVHDLTLI
jgi:hypothetical protein